MIPLDAAAEREAAGAKARTLARARRAGLPVLDGVVVLPSEAIDGGALAAAAKGLGAERVIVRSSASIEDRPGLAAPGVFVSVEGVPVEAGALAAAVERVRASGDGAAARAYCAAHGLGRPSVAVLIQPDVGAEARRLGVIYAAPDASAPLAAEERAPTEPEWGRVVPRRIDRDAGAEERALVDGARRLASLLGGPVDVEYALLADGPRFLQARPLDPRALATVDGAAWDPGLGADRAPATWRLDAEHNPAPLSTAQAALVARLEADAQRSRLRVIHGYLYFRVEEARDGGRAVEDPVRLLADEIAPTCEALLAPLEAPLPPDASLPTLRERLLRALAAFPEIAQAHGRLSRALAAARAALDQTLRAATGRGLAAHALLLGGLGGVTVERDQALWEIGRAGPAQRRALEEAYAARHGAFAPAWDVAVAPDDEAPERVRAAAALLARGDAPLVRQARAAEVARSAAAALLAGLDGARAATLASAIAAARRALPLVESDDVLFFRAQRIVRRPLVAFGRALVAAGRLDEADDVFDLDPSAILSDRFTVESARDARALRAEQSRLRAPSTIVRGPLGVLLPRPAEGGATLRGAGVGARARGRVLRLRLDGTDPAAPAITGDVVLVAPALLPSLGPLVAAAAAVVTEIGGALSHGATLAREYGVPAVLGAAGATRALADGDEVLVDGEAGLVVPLSAPSTTR